MGITEKRIFVNAAKDLAHALKFVDSGRDINDTVQPSGKTVLHLAAANAPFIVVEFLLENGANANAVDKDNKTPLYYALKSRNLESGNLPGTGVVQLLINWQGAIAH